MNSVNLVGRITRDPEITFYNTDMGYVKFTLAVNRIAKSKEERKADFINCIVWGRQAEALHKYITKGQLLGVEGSMRVETWEKDGKTNWKTEINCNNITFLEAKKNSTNQEYSSYEKTQQFPSNESIQDVPDDDNAPF